MKSRIAGVIPSRWGSTRFPGKSLALIGGRPLVVWVIERVRQASQLDEILVATDDARIAEVARKAGATVAMTRADHPSGTDRIAEAIRQIDADVVVNIQGDEPLIDPGLIDRVALALSETGSWDMATAAAPIQTAEELLNPDVVKVVRGIDGQALYFSRAPIPYERESGSVNAPVPNAHLRHIGLYGYQRSFLERLVKEPPCLLEEMEKLEQLRALSIGCRMIVLDGDASGIGVDSPADVQQAETLMRQAGILK